MNIAHKPGNTHIRPDPDRDFEIGQRTGSPSRIDRAAEASRDNATRGKLAKFNFGVIRAWGYSLIKPAIKTYLVRFGARSDMAFYGYVMPDRAR